MTYDHEVRFKTLSDVGDNDPASVQPLANGESVASLSDNRPMENMRVRTEALRAALEIAKYAIDYNVFVLASNALFTLTEPTAGQFVLTMSGDDLVVHPATTPGTRSGGRYRGGRVFVGTLPYSGVLGVSDLTLTCDGNFTGQRGYADGQNFATDTDALTLGANGILVDLIADGGISGGSGTVQFTITETPRLKVAIRYGTGGTPTTLAQLITAINGDSSSQGTYGVSNYFRASTTSAGSNQPVPFTGGVVRGAYDAEAHRVTPAQLADFFAVPGGVNNLLDQEGLAIGYDPGPVETGSPAPRGGRRQSLNDLPTDRIGGRTDNTSPAVGYNLFNTGREPEKIGLAVPIGKLVIRGGVGEFVFIDGTRCRVGTPVRLGDSSGLLVRLGAGAPSPGASLIGYGPTGNWNADQTVLGDVRLPGGTVQQGFNAIVSQLGATATDNSGARKLGGEAIAGTATDGNVSMTLLAGSMREQLQALLVGQGSNLGGGVVKRVSENGHNLHDFRPIEKNLAETTPINISAGGAVMLRGLAPLQPDAHTAASAAVWADTLHALAPMAYNRGGDDVLPATITVTGGAGSGALVVTLSNAVLTALSTSLGARSSVFPRLGKRIAVRLSGCNLSALDGWYYLANFTPGSNSIVLQSRTGPFPDFTGVTTGTLEMYHGLMIGLSEGGGMLRAFYAGRQGSFLDLGVIEQTTNIFTFSDAGGRNSFHRVSRSQWNNLVALRDSDNILVTLDKLLLDGVETGTAVDATANHHHGTLLTGFSFLAANESVVNTTYNTFNTEQEYALTPPAVGRTAVGVLLRVSVTMVSSGGGVGDRRRFGLNFQYPSKASPSLVHTYIAQGAGGPDIYIQQSVLAPCGPTGKFRIQNIPSMTENIVAASTTVLVEVLGWHLGYS